MYAVVNTLSPDTRCLEIPNKWSNTITSTDQCLQLPVRWLIILICVFCSHHFIIKFACKLHLPSSMYLSSYSIWKCPCKNASAKLKQQNQSGFMIPKGVFCKTLQSMLLLPFLNQVIILPLQSTTVCITNQHIGQDDIQLPTLFYTIFTKHHLLFRYFFVSYPCISLHQIQFRKRDQSRH